MPLVATIPYLMAKCLGWLCVLFLAVIVAGLIILQMRKRLPPRFEARKKEEIQRRDQ